MSMIGFTLNQTITSISKVTLNEYNDKTLITAYEDVRCRWQEKIEQATNRSGDDVTSKVQSWVLPDISVEEGYRVIKDSKTYVIVAYEKRYDLEGRHDHTKIYMN